MGKLTDREYLVELADMLDGATRFGVVGPETEGVCWIELSDEVAGQIAGRLRAIAWGLPDEQICAKLEGEAGDCLEMALARLVSDGTAILGGLRQVGYHSLAARTRRDIKAIAAWLSSGEPEEDESDGSPNSKV